MGDHHAKIARRRAGRAGAASALVAGALATATPAIAATSPTRPITVTAVGDLVMGSPPYGLPNDGGASLFTAVKPLLTGDVVLANLEGTLATGGRSKCGPRPGPNCYAFRTPPSYARWLPDAGIDVVTTANNHINDFGSIGRDQTRSALAEAGVRSAGWPGSITYLRRADGIVAVIGFGFSERQNSILDIRRAQALVRRAAARAGVVVVTMHSGAEGASAQHLTFRREVFLGENRGNPVRFARAMVRSGADLVVGHGPHVMRAMEVYRGRLIAYSLGNFMGYAVFNITGVSGESGVLTVRLAPDGRLAGGLLTSLRLLGRGVPAPGGTSVARVRALTRADVGASGARLLRDGRILPGR